MIYQVHRRVGGRRQIEAHHFEIDENGVLILRDEHGLRVAGVAAGCWFSIQTTEIEERA